MKKKKDDWHIGVYNVKLINKAKTLALKGRGSKGSILNFICNPFTQDIMQVGFEILIKQGEKWEQDFERFASLCKNWLFEAFLYMISLRLHKNNCRTF